MITIMRQEREHVCSSEHRCGLVHHEPLTVMVLGHVCDEGVEMEREVSNGIKGWWFGAVPGSAAAKAAVGQGAGLVGAQILTLRLSAISS
jgi:hypothetical protein